MATHEHLTLRRRYFPHGTFGELTDNLGTLLAVTVECPWHNNRPFISCIPEGEYLLRRHTSLSKGECLSIEGDSLGVTLYGPSLRTHCLVHLANRASELQGCIAPGTDFGVVKGDWAVLDSREALRRLISLVGDEAVPLTIERA